MKNRLKTHLVRRSLGFEAYYNIKCFDELEFIRQIKFSLLRQGFGDYKEELCVLEFFFRFLAIIP